MLPIPVQRYLCYKHTSLENGYRDDQGNTESCSFIASHLANLLLDFNQHPTLLSYRGQKQHMGVIIRAKPLIPRRYRGDIEWGGHTVCSLGSTILDPMVSNAPIDLANYPGIAFLNDANSVVITTTLSTSYLQQRKIEHFAVKWAFLAVQNKLPHESRTCQPFVVDQPSMIAMRNYSIKVLALLYCSQGLFLQS